MDVTVIAIAVVALLIFAYFTFRNNKKKAEAARALKKASVSSNKGGDVIIAKENEETPKAEAPEVEQVKYPDVDAYVFDNITGRCLPERLSGVDVGAVVGKYGSLGRPRDMERT